MDDRDDQLGQKLQALEQLVVTETPAKNTQVFLETNFGLSANPFPPSGIAGPSGANPPLRREVSDEILNFIERGYVTKKPQLLIIRGDYGTGKTHTLHFIEHTVNSLMNKGERAARAIYVERPRIEAQELNRAILHSLGHDTVRKYTWFAIREILLHELEEGSTAFDDFKTRLITPKKKGKKTGVRGPTLWDSNTDAKLTPFDNVFNRENVLDHRTFLTSIEENGWEREEVRSYLVYLLLQVIDGEYPAGLADAFVALLLAPDDVSFSSWETLVNISDSKKLASLRAPQFLDFLLQLLRFNGIVYVYLLLDEFEEVSQGSLLTPRQRQDYLYTMREVLNKIQEGLSVVIGISPPGWDAITAIATPLADVAGQIIELQPIDLEDAIRLVQYYVASVRQDSVDITSHSTEPISIDSLSFILNNFPTGVQPTPRNLVQFLHDLIDFVATNEVPIITPEVLKNRLLQFGKHKVAPRRSKG